VRQGLRRWLRRLHDEIHVTSVFVTHDQEEALELADEVAVMNQGRVEQVAAPDELFHRPASPFVMDFLGSVNLFHGRVENGRAAFGPLVLDDPMAEGMDGRAARAFVRPHDLELLLEPNGRPTLRARVVRVHRAGPVARIELSGEDEQLLLSEMSHLEYARTPVAPGDTVYLSPRQARVFVGEEP